MKALYVIYVLFISATTGEIEGEQVGDVPMTLEACNRTIVERGPVLAKDGVAIVTACKKLQTGLST